MPSAMTDAFAVSGYEPVTLPAGIYAPLPTAFTADEELDIDSTVRHAIRLAKAGVGLVVSGSTGEAISMTAAERAQVVYAIRTALTQQGDAALARTPIIAGTGGGSLRETIALSKDAHKAGADAVIVIAPGYFSSNLASDRNALKQFFTLTADASPLPVMVYNFPAAAGGIDMDSELLEEIATHPNICGAKLTCAGVGKAGRLANSTAVKGTQRTFHVFPGFGDILLPCMMIGATGAIIGTANVIPRVCVEHFRDIVALQQNPTRELMAKVQADQDLISRFDRAMSKGGVMATKYVLERFYYPQGPPRKPLQPTEPAFGKAMETLLAPALAREHQLEQQAGVKEDAQRT